ncbi:MAG: putative transport system ATP-binding protein [Actinomycetota bacterium]|jgi:putative ABC transport system ATP-binding protein|nr:putative transport system ATP-binding protein [Actinomycetota bacterium]
MTAALEARDLYRFYHAGDDETLALRGVSLEVEAGELVAVMGPSGSGKSTLLACLAGLDEPDGGMVRIDGEPLSRRSEETRAALRARSIGVLFQSGNLLDHLTVAENVDVARRLAHNVRTLRPVSDLLADLGIGDRAHSRPSRLSGGELARAGLAVAIANEPSVVLADEPTGELDHATASRVIALLRARADDGAAVVVVSHSSEIASASDRVIALHDGRVTV